MADETFDNVQLLGRHVPDFSQELGPDGNKVNIPLPGMYELGFVLGDKFITVASFKAGNYVDKDNKVTVNPSSQPSSTDEPASE